MHIKKIFKTATFHWRRKEEARKEAERRQEEGLGCRKEVEC